MPCPLTCPLGTTVAHEGLPWRLSGKEPPCQFRRLEFNPWFGKIPWRSKWQPTPVFLPGKSHRQRSLVGFSPWGYKSWTQLSEWVLMLMKSSCLAVPTDANPCPCVIQPSMGAHLSIQYSVTRCPSVLPRPLNSSASSNYCCATLLASNHILPHDFPYVPSLSCTRAASICGNFTLVLIDLSPQWNCRLLEARS